jgi:uncharacterized protein YprB with RNaseH-like and TPR domain
MSKLRDRLGRVTGESKPAAQDEKQQQLSDLRRRIAEIIERPRAARFMEPPLSTAEGLPKAVAAPHPPEARSPEPGALDLADVCGGEETPTPFGSIFVAHGEVDLGAFWGRRRLRELASVDMRIAALLGNEARLAACTPGDALFLDTETTGLAGGAGTLAFLIGLGWIEEQRFVTRQIFARDFTEEPAALYLTAMYAADRRFLITFNGKAFDLSLLSARYVLNRQRDPLSDLPHLDLLASARRLLRHRLENARLSTLEADVLGLHRDGDIPGSEIPQRYFAYLRTRDARLMADVLEHNRLDVISMAALAAHLAELARLGCEADGALPADVVAAARLHLKRGDAADAEALLRGLCAVCAAEWTGEGGRELSLIHKRAGRWDDAVTIWRARLDADPYDLFALLELAKWLEHRQRALAEAAELARRALEAPQLQDPALREAVRYRLVRLEKKRGG